MFLSLPGTQSSLAGQASLLSPLTSCAVTWLLEKKAATSSQLVCGGWTSLQTSGKVVAKSATWPQAAESQGAGGRKPPLDFQAELPVYPAHQSSSALGRCWALVQRLGSCYFVSLLDFILMFKTPLAGKLEGREVSSRIQAPDLPGNP